MTDNIVRSGDGVREPGADWLFKASALTTGGAFDFMVGEVAYASGPPLHTHDVQHDSFYVLAGTLTVQLGDDVVELRPGDFVTIPPGIPHTFDNLDPDVAVQAINVMVPGGLGLLFGELAAASASDDPNSAARDAARRHGVTRVGPSLSEKPRLA